MAWTRLLPNGRYQGCYRDACSRIRSAGVFDQKAEALRKAGAKEDEQRQPLALNLDGAKITWGAWFQMWHGSRDVGLAHNTDATYLSTAACHILPRWEDVRLMDIQGLEVQKWVTGMLRDKKSPYVVRNALMLFKASLNAAVYDNRLPMSPAKRVPYPDLPQGVERYLAPEEIERMAFYMDGENAVILWTAVQTGMRFGEVSGLHWNRIDFDRRVIRIVDQYDQKARVIKPAPKDKEARTVPIPPDLVAMLLQYRDTTEWRRAELFQQGDARRQKTCGIPHLSGHCVGDLVFRGPRLAVISSKEWGRGPFAKALGLAQIEGRTRVQDLRHTYASWLLQQGVHLAELSEVMGHSRWEVTQKYAHLSSGSHDTVRDALTAHRRAAGRAADDGCTALYDAASQGDEQAG